MIRKLARLLLAGFYLLAGVLHLVRPAPFVSIVPGFLPWPDAIVALTGIAEIAGAIALAQGRSHRLRQAGGLGLAAYALWVWPANFNHMLIDLTSADGGLGRGYHIPRLLAQPALVWLALWCGELLGRPAGK